MLNTKLLAKPIESIELKAKLLQELIEDAEFNMKWSVEEKLENIIEECKKIK